MTKRRQKLELTWIGKDNRPKLEPRILIEDPEKSYHAKHRVSENDIFDNRLIFGDNLLALKALEQEFAGMVKCVYIDPPFNTQQAFEHYDDGVEHSLWLSLMRDRLKLLHGLLAREGTLAVHIDDNELGYLLVLLDEIFGRNNKVFITTFKQGSATGHKAINPGCVSTSNYIVVYAKDKECWTPNKLYIPRDRNKRYNQFIKNRSDSCDKWEIIPLSIAFANYHGMSTQEIKRKYNDYEARLDDFVFEHAESVAQLARPDYRSVSAAARRMIDRSKVEPKNVFLLEREDHSDMYFIRGERIIFYKDTLKEIDGKLVPGEPLTTIWDDLPSHNLHNEGGVKFPKGKKPEALIKRIFELCTNSDDIVLDSFAGSGTTGAVAHKMRRRWIMVELGDHCHTHVIPRLQHVIDGSDDGGITKAVNWKGGGGFRYYKVGPSLIVSDEWDNPVINPEFKAEMLAEAMCKIEGFVYAPSEDTYWIHGKSTERDFIYITTQFMSKEMLTKISDDVGPDRSLLICCSAFRCNPGQFSNLTIKKIPKAVLSKCEWGHDDYSLEISNLPEAPAITGGLDDEAEHYSKTKPRKFGKDKSSQETLFDMGGDE